MKSYKGLTTESQSRMMMQIVLTPSLPSVSGALGRNLVVEHTHQEEMLPPSGDKNQHQVFRNQEDPIIESLVQNHSLDNLEKKGVTIGVEAIARPYQRKHRSKGPTPSKERKEGSRNLYAANGDILPQLWQNL